MAICHLVRWKQTQGPIPVPRSLQLTPKRSASAHRMRQLPAPPRQMKTAARGCRPAHGCTVSTRAAECHLVLASSVPCASGITSRCTHHPSKSRSLFPPIPQNTLSATPGDDGPGHKGKTAWVSQQQGSAERSGTRLGLGVRHLNPGLTHQPVLNHPRHLVFHRNEGDIRRHRLSISLSRVSTVSLRKETIMQLSVRSFWHATCEVNPSKMLQGNR